MGHSVSVPVAAISATTTAALVGGTVLPTDQGSLSSLVAAHFFPDTAQSAAGTTNYASLEVRDFSQNTTQPVVLATLALSAALVAETKVDFTLATGTKTGVAVGGELAPLLAATAVGQGDTIDVECVQAGTGGAVPAGSVVLEFQ